MGLTVGISPDSWGIWFPGEDEKQPPWDRFLDEVALAGYSWLELGPYGYLPIEQARLGEELEQRNLGLLAGIVLADLHLPSERKALWKEVAETSELAGGLGAKFLVLVPMLYSDLITGEMIGPVELDNDQWAELVKTTNELGSIARDDYDLTLVFHPHADSPVEYAQQVDRLLEDTDKDAVSLCLDTGHYSYRDGDPVQLMKDAWERIPYLHLKSLDPRVKRQVDEEGIPFAEAVKQGIMCEPQVGIVDFEGIAQVMSDVGYEGWAAVEQDMYPLDDLDKPLGIAQRTRQYFTGIGWN